MTAKFVILLVYVFCVSCPFDCKILSICFMCNGSFYLLTCTRRVHSSFSSSVYSSFWPVNIDEWTPDAKQIFWLILAHRHFSCLLMCNVQVQILNKQIRAFSQQVHQCFFVYTFAECNCLHKQGDKKGPALVTRVSVYILRTKVVTQPGYQSEIIAI